MLNFNKPPDYSWKLKALINAIETSNKNLNLRQQAAQELCRRILATPDIFQHPEVQKCWQALQQKVETTTTSNDDLSIYCYVLGRIYAGNKSESLPQSILPELLVTGVTETTKIAGAAREAQAIIYLERASDLGNKYVTNLLYTAFTSGMGCIAANAITLDRFAEAQFKKGNSYITLNYGCFLAGIKNNGEPLPELPITIPPDLPRALNYLQCAEQDPELQEIAKTRANQVSTQLANMTVNKLNKQITNTKVPMP